MRQEPSIKHEVVDVALKAPVLNDAVLQQWRQNIKNYYQLTKPGIVYSNVMTAVAGYLFASRWHVSLRVFAGLVLGTVLLIAASCVLNNYIDRPLDARMSRTRKRASVTGTVSLQSGLIYAASMLAVGLLVLALTNLLTMLVGVLAVVSYVMLYGVAKRRSVHGTLVGTIPGAAGLVAGYTAVMNQFDQVALLLFLVMVVWQMAHFYSIAIFRRDDYQAAGLPVRSVSRGVANTVRHIIWYVIGFTVLAPLLVLISQVGLVYPITVMSVGLLWLRIAVRGLTAADQTKWARQAFGFSLVALLVFSIALPLGVLLP